MPQPPRIFICYRRDDSAGHAIHLFDYLREHLRGVQMFMDIDIEPGEQFAQKIDREVGSCEIFLALIGKRWLAIKSDAGRRLDDPEDYVRLEVATALTRGVRVIPVLVDGARIPPQSDLPENIAELPAHQYLELSNQRWTYDADRLVRHIKRTLAEQREARRREESERQRLKKASAATPPPQRGLRVVWTVGFTLIALAAAFLFWMTYGRKAGVAQERPTPGSATARPSPTVANQTQPPRGFRNSIGMEFVWVPPDDFMMGAEGDDATEKPMHKVTVSGFYMGTTEVTQAQWQKVMGDTNPSQFKGDDLPVEQISWDTAIVFIATLNARDDTYTYRLPTEAEWEYAARAGTTGDYAGDLDTLAWYENNSHGVTHPVGFKQANKFGLYDMHGNVWEWCQDVYHDTYKGAPTDGSAWQGEDEQLYGVVRGGGWLSSAPLCRSAERIKLPPRYSHGFNGFRLVAAAKR